MPETPIHLGVDVGTQGVRCVAWREGGIVARHTAPLRTANPQSGWATQNPEEIWAAFREAVGGTVAALGPDRSAVHGLGIDATASIFITAPDGRPLMDSILWMDVRAEEYARTIGALVGQPESAELPWSKALWLFEHRPDLFQSGNQLVEVADWLIWRLTGQPVRSYASALLKWHAASRSGLPEWAKLFPEVVELLPTRVVGVAEPVEVIQPRAAESLGLPPGQVLVAGPIIDAYAGAIGSGALQNGTMALILGSSNCELFHGHDLPRQAGLWGPFADVYGLGLDVLEAGQPSTGSVVRWVERHFGHGLPLGELDRQAAAVAPGSDGLKVFPAFQGVRSPWPDGNARGKIHGLSLAHGPAHLMRAVYEGTAFDIRRVLDAVTAISVQRIVVAGGGSQSRIWLQVIADACELPLELTDTDSVTRGAAMLAAKAHGDLPDLSRLDQQWPQLSPSPAAGIYRSLYQEYLAEFPLRIPQSPIDTRQPAS